MIYLKQHFSSLISLLGAPLHYGQPKKGVELGLNDQLHIDLNDQGDLKILNNASNAEIVSDCCYNIYKKYIEHSNIQLTLGGDHSIAIGTLSGALTRDNNVGIIWVDAHADINTPNTSLTGNIHGMPISYAMNIDHQLRNNEFKWMNKSNIPLLQANQIVYIGLRDIDPAEQEFILKYNIKAYTMSDINQYGIGIIMNKALHYLQDKSSLHVSFDIDSVDPLYAPCTGTTVLDGLTRREIIHIAQSIAKTKKLIGIDLVEVNPLLKNNEQDVHDTVDIANTIIKSALGQTYLQKEESS